MKRLCEKTISYKLLLILAAAAMLICIAPMLMISRYSVPTIDDFSFSAETRHAVVENGSLFFVLETAAKKTATFYQAWQGAFSAVFLMSLQPGIWGYQYYCMTAWIMLASLAGGTFLFCRSLFCSVCRAEKFFPGIVASVLIIISTQFLPSSFEGFYWYNSAMYYTFFYGLTLFMFSTVLSYGVNGGILKITAASLLAIAVGGGNYVTALFSAVGLCFTIVIFALSRNKKWKTMLLPLILLLTSLAVSAAAPGNAVRQSQNPVHPGAIEAVFLSIKAAWDYMKEWVDLGWLGMMLVLLPVALPAAKSADFSFKYPAIVTVASFILLSVSFCPHIYAMGSEGPVRIINIIYFFFLIASAVNLFWWCGWLSGKKTGKTGVGILPGMISLLAGLLLTFSFIKISNVSVSSVMAVHELRSGRAEAYYMENIGRLDILNDDSVKDAVLPALENTPFVIFREDMGNDPLYYVNRDAATYFYKNSIVVI